MVIDAPEVCDERLETNDLAEIQPDGSFKLLGRRDNVICSGGIKLRIEQIEAQLAGIGVPYQITASPDERLGETVTLFYVASTDRSEELEAYCRSQLDAYEVPRRYLRVDALPLTETGKPARAAARQLAAETN